MIGKTLSNFRITAKLGEGGMGEVYRAEDLQLGREVAVKLLPASLTDDPERLARFEREARVLASLNHPNVAGIHQIADADGQRLLVMELVEGEDLAERLKRGPIPVEEAVEIASQVADGLEAAHERGIVHRDLKPANIKVDPDGQVKILDFGLAKAREGPAGTSIDASRSPTLTAQMTMAGVILGTAAYMSPEQARGQEADRRSDLWALGVVLWEMLTGARLFSEPTVSDTLAAVLRAEIDDGALPDSTSPRLRRVLLRSLERDPKGRYHSAADLRLDLVESLGVEQSPAARAEPSKPASRLPWVIAAVAVTFALLAALWALRPSAQSSAESRAGSRGGAAATRLVTSILPPDDVDFSSAADALALSPDGTELAFVGVDGEGRQAIWIRSLSLGAVRRLPGTEGASSPFWSADGRFLGFLKDTALQSVEVESGLVEVLGPVGLSWGASWSRTGEVVYGTDIGALHALKRSGGAPYPVTGPPDAYNSFLGPDFLPDGRHFLFHERRYSSDQQIGQIWIGSLDGEESRVLFEAFSMVDYAEPGFVLFWQQGSLRAQGFDAERFELVGEPFSVASDVLWDPRSGEAGYTASDNGILIYRSGGRLAGNRLTWIGRDGQLLGTVGEAGSLYSPDLSADGRQVAVDISGDSNQGDIWILDVERGTATPWVTWAEDESYPVWSPDGRELAFFSTRGGGASRIFRLDLTGDAEPVVMLVIEGTSVLPRVWSPDGRSLLFLAGTYGDRDIGVLDIETGDVQMIVEGDFNSENPSLSPDGRWFVYDSNETGQDEVYLAAFPSGRQRVRVSANGGYGPLWSPTGSEVFFTSIRADALLSVEVTFDEGRPRLGRPVELFSADIKAHEQRQFDTADGERFLVNLDVHGGVRTPLTVIQNWPGSAERP